MTNNTVYCSVLHGGLTLGIDQQGQATANHCCLHNKDFPVDTNTNFWYDPKFESLRKLNQSGQWASECAGCQQLEATGNASFRTGMNQLLGGEKINMSGPFRLNLLFDIGCNLACRTCGPGSSTYWQKYLKSNGQWHLPIIASHNQEHVITALSRLDLSNLQQVVFAGGETLMGQEYWKVAQWLVDNVPNAKQQLTLCFQSNGTQEINSKNFDIIEQAHLVKIHFSLDDIGQRFNYLRWPADWNQVTDNIFSIRESAPSNVMFLIEQTISIFNLLYLGELDAWINQNFATNREGDVVEVTKHLATGVYSLDNLSQEYRQVMTGTEYDNLIPNIKENPVAIAAMLDEIQQHDAMRNQDFKLTFPELASVYSKFFN